MPFIITDIEIFVLYHTQQWNPWFSGVLNPMFRIPRAMSDPTGKYRIQRVLLSHRPIKFEFVHVAPVCTQHHSNDWHESFSSKIINGILTSYILSILFKHLPLCTKNTYQCLTILCMPGGRWFFAEWPHPSRHCVVSLDAVKPNAGLLQANAALTGHTLYFVNWLHYKQFAVPDSPNTCGIYPK